MSENGYTDGGDVRQPPELSLSSVPEKPAEKSIVKKVFGYIALAFALAFKFLAKLKFVVIPVIKFLPVLLKTGGTMVLSIWFYALTWGWWFAVGFVVLMLIHECGHLLAAKRIGLKVGAPVFIPFMGAFIALKEAPRDAWIEAQIGLGGPLLGALGAFACHLVYVFTGANIFRGLAYTGYLLNLFNLVPLTPLDGGRICTALSPWIWLVGLVIILAMTILTPNIILFMLLIFSAPKVFSLFRKKSTEEKRYFEVTRGQRVFMAVAYFGLAGLLWLGMTAAHMPPR